MRQLTCSPTIRRGVTLVFILALTITIGCSTKYVWQHSSKDDKGYQTDRYQCEEEAAKYSNDLGKGGNKEIVSKRLTQCMQVRGYIRVPDDQVAPGAKTFE